RRRRRGRRGGRRRSRRPDRDPSAEGHARPQGWQDRPQPAEAAGQPVPGLGDQPTLSELPEQWAQRVEPLTSEGTDQSQAATASAEIRAQPDEPQGRRRQRRPRRRDEDTAVPAAEPMHEVEAARAASNPVEPAPVSQPSAAPASVQVIEVGAEGDQTAGDDADQGQRKRGWWRRLIE
ncbi:MAG TPA: hypothetical protein VGJ75_10010, partial [Dongiaceae bacterium]